MIGELYPGEFEAMEHNGRMDALEQELFEDWCDVPSDEMTLEQARQAVKDLRKKLAEYLEQEPCDVFDEYGNYKYPSDVELTEPNTATSMPCEDAISRQAAINEAFEVDTKEYGRIEVVGVDAIESLPPVTPQPKTGKWIYEKNLKQFFCNKCGYPSLTDDDKYIYSMDLPNFCENCGAKMVEPQESEG